ncbi:MAG: cobalt ECF transporter T component CbiQ [Desulfuromonadales bacterium]
MQSIDDLKQLDLLADGDSTIHRLDPRAKVLVTLIFIISVISFGTYELAALLPFSVFPIVMISLARLPPLYIARKIVLIWPYVILIGIFNPVFDREMLLQFGMFGISGGWVSFISMLVRSALTVGAALILIGTTGFTSVCQALEQMGMPQVFTVQLLFLYRYIFVLSEEGDRASRARELRSCGKKGMGMRSFSSMTGHLLLRTWQRAERIHMAMLARGFVGIFHARRQSRFGKAELLFVLGWGTLFILLRTRNIPLLLGSLVTDLFI